MQVNTMKKARRCCRHLAPFPWQLSHLNSCSMQTFPWHGHGELAVHPCQRSWAVSEHKTSGSFSRSRGRLSRGAWSTTMPEPTCQLYCGLSSYVRANPNSSVFTWNLTRDISLGIMSCSLVESPAVWSLGWECCSGTFFTCVLKGQNSSCLGFFFP